MSKPTKPRVLHVVDSLGMGGAETWLMELLRFWAREGENAAQLDFVATSGKRGHFDDEVESLGGRIFYLRFGRAHLATFVRGWREILRQGDYAAIHDHQDFASGWHFLAGVGSLPPVRIAHVHNPMIGFDHYYGITSSRRLTAMAGWKLVDRLATHICGTSAEILQKHGYRPGHRSPSVAVVHCGIDVNKFSGKRGADRRSVLEEFGWLPDSKIVLSVGRLDPALEFSHPQNLKNTWFALNVVRHAALADPSVHYLVAGAGEAQRSAIMEHVRQWGLDERIRLIGLRNDVPRLMRAADLLLFPSVEEGLGMVAVEAQAAGLPVLASTAVPDECIVVPQLYHSISLQEPLRYWATSLLAILGQPRISADDCQLALERTGFSIANSARHLMKIYSKAS